MATTESVSPPRYDALDKATGQAMYTEDLPIPPGTVFGRVLLSPFSHARIRSIDVTQAEHLRGVMAVLTRDHLGGLTPYPRNLGAESGVGRLSGGPGQPHQPFIATDKVRFDGEPVAAVAAETLAIADQALQLIDVEYEELPPVFDPSDAVTDYTYDANGNRLSVTEPNGNTATFEYDALDRLIEARVLEDDVGALASQFEGEAFACASGRGSDFLANLGRPGEGDLVDIGMADERCAGAAVAGDDVDDTLG